MSCFWSTVRVLLLLLSALCVRGSDVLFGTKVPPLFSVCAVLANVSSLTNNTSCEAASIIKKSRLVAHVVWVGFSF